VQPGDPIVVEKPEGCYVMLVPCAGREMSPAVAGPTTREIAEGIAQKIRAAAKEFDDTVREKWPARDATETS